MLVAVIESPDGYTFEQSYSGEFEDLLELKKMLGRNYWICDIYDPNDYLER